MPAASRPPVVYGGDGLAQNLQSGDALQLPAYTVANLPTGAGIRAGAHAYATNGRALNTTASLVSLSFEAAGAGTGCAVTFNGTAWKVDGTNSTVQA